MLTRARMRDRIAERTELKAPIVAQVLDALEDLIREELTQQGSVVFRGLFRIVPIRRKFAARIGDKEQRVERIVLVVKTSTSLRDRLSSVLSPR